MESPGNAAGWCTQGLGWHRIANRLCGARQGSKRVHKPRSRKFARYNRAVNTRPVLSGNGRRNESYTVRSGFKPRQWNIVA